MWRNAAEKCSIFILFINNTHILREKCEPKPTSRPFIYVFVKKNEWINEWTCEERMKGIINVHSSEIFCYMKYRARFQRRQKLPAKKNCVLQNCIRIEKKDSNKLTLNEHEHKHLFFIFNFTFILRSPNKIAFHNISNYFTLNSSNVEIFCVEKKTEKK